MKTLKLTIIGLVLFLSGALKAQVSVNVNVGSPPMWGPVGYTDVRYYYIPDIEAYYDVQTSMFIYFGDGIWIHRAYLPSMYSNYDLYNGYKVVINNYYGNAPYVYFHDHKAKYHKGYRGGPQKTIGPKPGSGNNKMKESPNRQKSNQMPNSNGGNKVGGGNRGTKNINQSHDKGSQKGQGNGGNHGGGKGKNK
jgi:hypothetical protein